jgi:peptide/nickel transport system substrate-binding protein
MRQWLITSTVLVFLALGVPPADAAQGQVSIALTGEPLTMDPHIQSEFIGTMIWPWACDNLIQSKGEEGGFKPWLAEKFERIDAKTWKFTIRKDAKFFDGTPVTAEAVKFSLERILDPKVKSRLVVYFKSIDRVETPDTHTAILHLKSPDNGILNLLQRWGHVVSPKVKDMDSAAISREPHCSGPYVLKEWTKGQRMVFEANPAWWGNALYPNRPKTVILRSIKESTTRVKALISDEMDVITGVEPHFVPEIKANPNMIVASVPSVRIMYMGFFTGHSGPFADVRVRQAVSHAINSEGIVKTFLGGFADRWQQMLHPWMYSGYDPKLTWYGYDPAKARQLLKEAGYAEGFKAHLFGVSGRYPADKEICEALAGMLKEIKIDAPCNAQVFPLYRRTFTAFQQGTRKEPALYLQAFGNGAGYTPVSFRGFSACGGAWSPHCFKEFDDMLDKAVGTADTGEQQGAYERVGRWMRDNATHVPILKTHEVWGLNKNVQFKANHNENLPAWEIVVKKPTN